MVLYVGVREEGAPQVHYREPPEELVLLPEEVHDTYVHFLATVEEASREGDLSEDLTAGHSLLSYARAREQQEKFQVLAGKYLAVLRDVLHHSFDAEHRAIAAYVIGYAPDKKTVVADLIEALRDPDETVRDNAMRALAAISVLALRKPELGIKIDATPFVE
ncbi:MAG: HEAT repeat domain-containing protein, partial [Thermoleophilia bacterium]|nr:HEAT repeat domain-containing protein [Thermoleophilia bacterium]